jgi:hypothetical protein
VSRVCVIYIDSERLNDVSKVWIQIENPSSNTEMWWNESEIGAFIEALPEGWDPSKTLHMSWIDGYKDLVQLLIPPQLVGAEGNLGLSAICTEEPWDLPDQDTVNYDDWQTNITGDRGPQRYPESSKKKRKIVP